MCISRDLFDLKLYMVLFKVLYVYILVEILNKNLLNQIIYCIIENTEKCETHTANGKRYVYLNIITLFVKGKLSDLEPSSR